uniref:CD2 antigen cytoplasmic tail-binding protein 2 homolog n=2 Tax=Hirondellea gigas TaxID=1518452 RepID=A0A2P2HXS2_9CRUS
MSKKRGAVGPYSYDDDDDYVPTKAVNYSTKDEQPGPAKKKAHTLDSDEEDDDGIEGLVAGTTGCVGSEKSHDVMKEDDIEGQEEQTVEYEGETNITPFNMKDEMEDGHFDGDGFYHFKKDFDLVKDAWLDDIDWMKVKRTEENKDKYGSDDEDSDADDVDTADANAGIAQKQEKDAMLEIYKKIIELIHPGETVTKGLKRFGGGRRLTSAQKWKMKKQSKGAREQTVKSAEDVENMDCMLRLTELASKIVEAGNMDVYEETYEMIKVKLQPAKPSSPSMDMFTDEPKNSDSAGSTDNTTNGKSQDDKSTVDEVRWQLKWENKDGAEVHGPFPSSQMVKWQDSGYLDKGAYVRKISDNESAWYHTKRMDFELYI